MPLVALPSAPRPLGCPSPPKYPALCCLSFPPSVPASTLIKPPTLPTPSPLPPPSSSLASQPVCYMYAHLPFLCRPRHQRPSCFSAALPPLLPPAACPAVGIARCAIGVTSVRLGCGSGQVSPGDGTTTLPLARGLFAWGPVLDRISIATFLFLLTAAAQHIPAPPPHTPNTPVPSRVAKAKVTTPLKLFACAISPYPHLLLF